jgi:arylsulfatase A-like enzyme/polygalacturonase
MNIMPILPSHRLPLLGAIITLGALAFAAGAAEPPRPPNIVLIYTDDLGYGDLGCYGATKIATPHIDRLAREGLRFTGAYATSATCTPSRYALLTGEYPWRLGGGRSAMAQGLVLDGNAGLLIPLGRPTLPSLLQGAGYATTVIGKWHLGLGAGNLDWNGDLRPGPCEIGFDSCFLMPATGDRVPCVYVENHRVVGLDPKDPIAVSYTTPFAGEPVARDHPELLKYPASHGHDQAIINGIGRIGYMRGGVAARWVDEDIADVFTRRAMAFIEQNRAKPFFLFFSTHDIHVPRVPHTRFLDQSGLGRRGDATLQLDWSVGEILATLDRLGLAENTLVIFTSDNGPIVDDGYRDGSVEKLGGHQPAGPLRGAKYSAFEGGPRVPFIVRWPGRVQPGVSPALFSQVDLAATFAAIAGRPVAPGTLPDGRDASAALLGADRTGRDHLVEQAFQGPLSVIRGNWKYIEPSSGKPLHPFKGFETGNHPSPQLYNLAADLGETRNLAAAHPVLTAELAALLADIRARPAAPPPPNLSAPPLARTATTVLLMWDRPADGATVTSYRIFRDGEPAGETTSLSYTARDLAPGKTYRFTVRSIRAGSAVSADSEPVVVATKPAGPVLNVRERGARGDGVTRDTAVIQQAINDCPPGGTVLVPPGTYLVGHLELKGDLTFDLATGATLQFLGRDQGDYPEKTEILPGPDGDLPLPLGSLITARQADNLTITGGGRIRANGESWWPHPKLYRPRVLLFIQCTNLLVQGITIEDPPFWNTHALYVDHAIFADLTYLRAFPAHSVNADGIDLDSTRHALVVGCTFANQDDSIAVKCGAVSPEQPRRQRSSEHITIRDCRFDGTLAPGARPLGIALGSENSGSIRHVLVKDCSFLEVASLAYLKTNRLRAGAVIEDIRFENCTLTNTRDVKQAKNRGPIAIDMFYYDDAAPESAVPLTPTTPVMQDIHFSNIVIHEAVRRGITLVGLAESPVRNLTFTNVTVTAKTGLLGQNLHGIELRDVSIEAQEGPAYTWINVERRTERSASTASTTAP